MRPILCLLTLLPATSAALPTSVRAAEAPAEPPKPIRVLVVTGGHDYATNQFRSMFADLEGITVQTAEHPNAHAHLAAEAAKAWDVLVLYDMWQPISEEAKANFVARLKEGKGLVALHHSLASYQEWPEYERIIGGRYNLEKRTVDGVERPRSTYQHDVQFRVKVVNPQHPVTRGVTDFDIHDETYGQFDVSPQAHALLATDAPTSGKTIAWARNYEAARVVYVQLGHDEKAYAHPQYRRLVANAIRWVARRD
jgi:type 1 glutamine amidotransferase